MPPETIATPSGNGTTPIAVKPGRHREASLYHALAGAGAGDGRSLADLRAAAREVFAHSELPIWRRSGFWTTTFAELDLDSLAAGRARRSDSPSSSPMRCRTVAGRAGSSRSTTRPHTSSSTPMLAAKGVLLCSLAQAAEEHPVCSRSGTPSA